MQLTAINEHMAKEVLFKLDHTGVYAKDRYISEDGLSLHIPFDISRAKHRNRPEKEIRITFELLDI